MRIDQVTKYRCDGCRTEQQNPRAWRTLQPMYAGGFTMIVGTTSGGSDYCSACVQAMLDAIGKEQKPSVHAETMRPADSGNL